MTADTRRIIRALEVCLKGSRTMSEMHETLTIPLPYEFLKVGLARDRKELYRLIDARVDLMMENGLLKEVETVIQLIENNGHGSKEACSALQAIGYKEIAMHMSGGVSLEEAIGLIKQRSRNYAKRQLTWFNKEEGIHWIDITGIFDPGQIFQKIREAAVVIT